MAPAFANGFIPLPPDFPEEAAAWECSGHRVSAQVGPAGAGPGPTGREGGQPDPLLGGGGREPGNVTPHLGQIYRLSMGPVVAGDLISLGLHGGQEKKAAWASLSPGSPGASLGHTGWPRHGFAWDKSLHAIVYLMLEGMAFFAFFLMTLPPPCPPPSFQVLNHLYVTI